MPPPRVVVVGAGVIGVSTAYNIKKLCPEAEVTIVAEQFSPNTTSDVAAGMCLCYWIRDTPLDKQRRWTKETLDHLLKLHQTEEGPRAGVQIVSGYIMDSSGKKENDVTLFGAAEMCLGHRRMTSQELQGWPTMKAGVIFSTLGCECVLYLPWLLNKFKDLGGKTLKKTIGNLIELHGDYDVVVNCCGIGAYQLCGDTSVEPVRGQIFRVLAPWVKHIYIFPEENAYLIPCINELVVGGTSDIGSWNCQHSEHDKERIWRGTLRLMPSMANATILKTECGLRPTRPQVRLEMELVQHKHKTIPVITPGDMVDQGLQYTGVVL